jgi:hypothetical protein
MLSENDILNVLRNQPGVKGSEIASQLNAGKPEIKFDPLETQESRADAPGQRLPMVRRRKSGNTHAAPGGRKATNDAVPVVPVLPGMPEPG